MLQWAHANGCPWDSKTCAKAAGIGHLTMLQGAHANMVVHGIMTRAEISLKNCICKNCDFKYL
jgi:hypothetical protein